MWGDGKRYDCLTDNLETNKKRRICKQVSMKKVTYI